MKYLSETAVRAYILALPPGRIFRATFDKRDGKRRVMVCRTGVIPTDRRGTERAGPAPEPPGLVRVWDVHEQGYRYLNAWGTVELVCGDRRLPHPSPATDPPLSPDK